MALTVDTTKLGSLQDLKLAFVSGADTGAASITDVHVIVTAGSTTVVDQDFTTAAGAVAWFHDNALTVGALSSFTSGGLASIGVTLSVNSTGTAASFGGTVVLGNAPGPFANGAPRGAGGFGHAAHDVDTHATPDWGGYHFNSAL